MVPGTISESLPIAVYGRGDGQREGVPDGMKIDSKGNLCTIHYCAPDSSSLKVIYMPEGVANFTWGEDDLRNMLVTASTWLCRVWVMVPPATLP